MSKQLSKTPNKPSVEEVEKYINQWNETEMYSLSENSLNELFKRFPLNSNLNEIIVKVCTLDVVFSANVNRWFFEVSDHIKKYNFDTKFGNNDLNVNDFAIVSVVDKKTKQLRRRNFYSFATKYCNHHNSEGSPIYDSYVDKALWYFKNEYHFKDFSRKALKIYPTFIDILKEFRVSFKLQRFDLREIDKYLWLLGKEYFPNNY